MAYKKGFIIKDINFNHHATQLYKVRLKRMRDNPIVQVNLVLLRYKKSLYKPILSYKQSL